MRLRCWWRRSRRGTPCARRGRLHLLRPGTTGDGSSLYPLLVWPPLLGPSNPLFVFLSQRVFVSSVLECIYCISFTASCQRAALPLHISHCHAYPSVSICIFFSRNISHRHFAIQGIVISCLPLSCTDSYRSIHDHIRFQAKHCSRIIPRNTIRLIYLSSIQCSHI